MKLKSRIGLSGEFPSIEVLGTDGKVRRSIEGPKNLITDIGLERLSGTVGPVYSFCRVGAGNSVPSPLDRQLDAQIGSAGSGNAVATEGLNLEENYIWLRIVWTFPLGAVVGNVSELATGWASTGDTIFSRALVRDSAGNPTSVTVLEDEQLRITWEHRRYWQANVSSGEIVNEGNKGGTYQWQILPRNVSSWRFATSSERRVLGGGINSLANYSSSITSTTTAISGATDLGDMDSEVQGGAGVSPAGTSIVVLNPTSIVCRFRFTVSQGLNAAGINAFNFGTLSTSSGGGSSFLMFYKALITPAILKTDEDFLELDFEISWGRHEST